MPDGVGGYLMHEVCVGGWLPYDHPPVEELRNFVRQFFDKTSENQ